jgi:hypothetical protein
MVSAFSDADWAGCMDDRKFMVLPYFLDLISSHDVLRSNRQSLDQVMK